MAAVSEELRAIVDAVLDDLDRITAEGVARIVAEVPDYAEGALVGPDDLTRQLRQNLEGILTAFVGKDPGDQSLRLLAVATGLQRADQGVALESLLQAYRFGAQEIWQELLARAQRGPAPLREELLVHAIGLWTIIDEASSAVADAYRERNLELTQLASMRRETLLDALFAGRGEQPAVAEAAQTQLGLPVGGRYVVVCVAVHEQGRTSSARIAQALASLRLPSVWRTRLETELGIVLIGATPIQRLVRILTDSADSAIGCSDVVSGLDQLGLAATLAENTVATVRRTDGARVAVVSDRLPEVLLLSQPDLADRLRQRFLGQILELPEEDAAALLATLESWLRHGRSAALAAEQLHCHRNTVFNRLRRIEELAGHSLDDEQGVGLQLALMAYRLRRG